MIFHCNLNQDNTGSNKVLKLQFVSPSLQLGVYKYWLCLFFISHLQNNTCSSKQPPSVSMCLPCSPERHRLQLSKPNPKRDPEQNKTVHLLPCSQEELIAVLWPLFSSQCPWNTQIFNPARVLSAHCLCGVGELTSLQIRMAFHERERDSMKIIIQRWRSSKEISKHSMVSGFTSFPQLGMAVFQGFPTAEESPSQIYRHISHPSAPPESSDLLFSSTLQLPT